MDSLFVPSLQPALKHPTILKKFDDLQNGEAFFLLNVNETIPLYYVIKADMVYIF